MYIKYVCIYMYIYVYMGMYVYLRISTSFTLLRIPVWSLNKQRNFYFRISLFQARKCILDAGL